MTKALPLYLCVMQLAEAPAPDSLFYSPQKYPQ